MSRRAVTAAMLSFLAVVAGNATAADHLLTGKKLLLSLRTSGQERAIFIGTGDVVPPASGSADDPTVAGATLLIQNPTSGESGTMSLPAAHWRRTGSGYAYKGDAHQAGTVKVGLFRSGKIKVTATDTAITLDEPSQGNLAVVVTSGSEHYCARFDGRIVRDQPGTFSAKNAPTPVSCTRAGTSTDVIIPSNVDGAAIAFTVHEPTVVVEGHKYPLILEGHGYGGSRVKAANRPASGGTGLLSRLLDDGFGIISIDQRGHGDSGGKIRILDPDFEGKDLVQLLDWAEDNLDWLAYRDGNLLLGATGQSYGGGFQHTIYAHDPKHRLDAIAPEITWHDLRYSLFSGHVFKSFWASFLSFVGNLTPGGQDQEVNDGLANGLANNDLTQQQQDLLKKDSLIASCEAHTLPPIDALYWQSSSDTLFNMNDAVHNVECVRALGGDVRLLTKNSGHDSLVPGLGAATGEQCGRLKKVQAIVDWYEEKLKGVAGKASYIPQNCFHIDGSASDAVVTSSIAIGGSTFDVPPTLIVAQDGSPQVASIPLTTIGAGGAVLAGVPTIQLSVADPLMLQQGDPILFIGLAKRPAGSQQDTLLQPNQVRPFRGYGAFDDELVGATFRLAAGDQVRLVVYASFVSRYPNEGTDAAAPVSFEATVGVPLLPANLPAPPTN